MNYSECEWASLTHSKSMGSSLIHSQITQISWLRCCVLPRRYLFCLVQLADGAGCGGCSDCSEGGWCVKRKQSNHRQYNFLYFYSLYSILQSSLICNQSGSEQNKKELKTTRPTLLKPPWIAFTEWSFFYDCFLYALYYTILLLCEWLCCCFVCLDRIFEICCSLEKSFSIGFTSTF